MRKRSTTIRAGRKATFEAVGRISPDYYCMDGKLPEVLHRMQEMSSRYGLQGRRVSSVPATATYIP